MKRMMAALRTRAPRRDPGGIKQRASASVSVADDLPLAFGNQAVQRRSSADDSQTTKAPIQRNGLPILTIEKEDSGFSSYQIRATLNRNGEEIGSGWAQFELGDDQSPPRLHILRVDVDEEYQGRGYGLAITQALCQAVLTKDIHPMNIGVDLVADESETPGLRDYYGRMRFEEYDDETDKPEQHPMRGKLGSVITNLQNWRAWRAEQKGKPDPVIFQT